MKKVIPILSYMFLFVFAFANCTNKKEKKISKMKEHLTLADGKVIDSLIKQSETPKLEIPINKENFNMMVAYIEDSGFVSPFKGVPCDHQYNFLDSRGNLHEMIAIRRDENDDPSVNGQILAIAVWGYYEGKRDESNCFMYDITPRNIIPYDVDSLGVWKEVNEVKLGYNEFLAKVLKK